MANENTPDTPSFRPNWLAADADLACLLDACYAADPDELSPQLALADMLAERDDPREKWVRAGCELWTACRELRPSEREWNSEAATGAFTQAATTESGRRVLSLFGCLLWLQNHTALQPRLDEIRKRCWWWAVGFIPSDQLATTVEELESMMRAAEIAAARARAEESRAANARQRAVEARDGFQPLQIVRTYSSPGGRLAQPDREEEKRWLEKERRERAELADAANARLTQATETFRDAMAIGYQVTAIYGQVEVVQTPEYAAQAIINVIDSLDELTHRALGETARGSAWRFARSVWELCEPFIAKLAEA